MPGSPATRKLELRGDIPARHTGSRSATPLLRNPTEVRHCSQHAGANVDFGDEGAVDWAFLGNLKQLRETHRQAAWCPSEAWSVTSRNSHGRENRWPREPSPSVCALDSRLGGC